MAVSFVDELLDAINLIDAKQETRNECAAGSALFAPRLPPQLRTLVIQPAAVPDTSSQFRSVKLKDEMMMLGLSELARRTPHRDLKVVLCERDTPLHNPYEQALRDWTDRLDSGLIE